MDIKSKTDHQPEVEDNSPTFEAGQIKVDTEELGNSSDLKSTQRNKQEEDAQSFIDNQNNIDKANAIYGFKAYIKANGGNPDTQNLTNLRIEKLHDI